MISMALPKDAAVSHAGLVSAPFITVDDTGARDARAICYATQLVVTILPPFAPQKPNRG